MERLLTSFRDKRRGSLFGRRRAGTCARASRRRRCWGRNDPPTSARRRCGGRVRGSRRRGVRAPGTPRVRGRRCLRRWSRRSSGARLSDTRCSRARRFGEGNCCPSANISGRCAARRCDRAKGLDPVPEGAHVERPLRLAAHPLHEDLAHDVAEVRHVAVPMERRRIETRPPRFCVRRG